jgi:hypothetical protein
MERIGVSDIEGKATRVGATELGSEGVSIMKDEMKATLAKVYPPRRASGG